MGLSKQLAEYMIATDYEKLPKEVVEFTKLCILDYFGSAVAGKTTRPIQMIEEYAREMGGFPQATLVAGGKTSVVQAAFVNGASSHRVELDDIHKASIMHAATVVIPPALAIAEWKGLSGKDLITAIVIGYEVSYRIGEAVTPSHYYYWHNTATCGTFGAAAAVAKLLNLDVKQMINTLGSAGTQAAGLWEFIEDGAMSKQLHPGKAAMNGLLSALLAEKGFTAAQSILEGHRGFFTAMSQSYDSTLVTKNLGNEFKIMENGFKIHASCRHTHHAMDMMLELKQERAIPYDQIEKIIVKTYQDALNITDNDNPQTVYAAKFSLQFCTALAIVKGDGGFDMFNDEIVKDSQIRSLMEKIELQRDPFINQAYPEKWGVQVEVLLTNGERIVKKTDYPKGDPENPVTAAELYHKFMKLTKDLPNEQQEKIAEIVMELEKLANVDELMKQFN